jgi:hypothetical protein
MIAELQAKLAAKQSDLAHTMGKCSASSKADFSLFMSVL